MISSVSEYLFVTGADVDAEHQHGDMDRIIINGGIMPLRSGNTESGQPAQNVLRGEDAAFLMEALCERVNLSGQTNPSGDVSVFTRKPGPNLCAVLDRFRSETNFSTYMKRTPSHNEYDVAESYYSSWIASNCINLSDLTTPDDAFDTGKKLIKSNVLSMFTDIGSAKIVFTQPGVTAGTLTGTKYDQDADYPYRGGVTAGYRSYGGVEVSDDHKNAYGGYSIGALEMTISTNDGMHVPIITSPLGAQVWVLEKTALNETIGGVTRTDTRYDFVQISNVSTSGSYIVATDNSSQRMDRLLDAMRRFWNISPGFIQGSGDLIEVSQSYSGLPMLLITVGNHTRWS